MKRFVLVIASLLSAVLIPLQAQVNVITYHNDNARTGQNTQETLLTPNNVNSAQFGKLFTVSVQGYVYAQPLYLANVQNIAGGTHNVLFVATEHDQLYALDADNGNVLWQQSFINPPNITTVTSSEVSCTDLVPEIGITSTPVIDQSTGTIYVVTKTKETGVYVQRLHAIDIVTHAEKFGGPVTISASVNGQTFDPLRNHNRPGLLLENGHVVIAWASHCDNTPYHGWVMSYKAGVQPTDTLTQEAVFNGSPNGGLAGIWMSGDGVAADANGNLFFATGNGTYDGLTGGDFGDSIMKLGPPSSNAFPIVDWFTPWNQQNLSDGDVDLGSGGLLLLPDLPAGSAHQHLLVQMGKEGKVYLVDRDNMGKFCSNCSNIDTQIVQEIPGATTGVWGSPAYWNGSVYWGGGNDGGNPDHLKAFSFNANNSGVLSTSPTSQSTKTFSFPTAAPVISANGNSNGIAWLVDNGNGSQALYAYDATNLVNMFYNSTQAPNGRDALSGPVKFTAPIIANGKVYLGSQGSVSAFGLLNQTPTAATPTFNPAPGNFAGSVNVTLSDGTSGATVHCTTDSSTPTASSPVCTSFTFTTTTTLRAIGTESGYNDSAIANGTYTVSNQASTTTSLTSAPNPSYVTQTVTYTANVQSVSGTPTGSVSFIDNRKTIAIVALTNGQAVYSLAYATSLWHTITAIYSGDTNNQGSTSNALRQVVRKLPARTTTSLITSGTPSKLGQTLTFTATVSSTFGTPPDGESVTFSNGTTGIGTGTLSGGVATFSTSSLSAASHNIKAAYAGDTNFVASTGHVTQVVTKN